MIFLLLEDEYLKFYKEGFFKGKNFCRKNVIP